MKAIVTTSKVVLVTALLSVAFAGCGRKEPNQASDAAGTSGTATAPGSTAGTSSSAAGTSGSAPDSAAGTSGSSDTSSSGASGSRGAGSSAGAAIDDSIISTKVKTALLADADIKGTDISVETRQGEVLLSGFVRDKAQIDKAVKVASAVEGVKKVDNKMTVKQ